MMIKFQNDQVRLLEIFSSNYYFGAMRDKWEEMIKHTESCLNSYMAKLPLNYRSKPLPDQPDIVWGHRVLPNFRYTLEELNSAFIMLTHGDISALGYSNNVRSDFKGQLDYIADWMSEADRKKYEEDIYSAVVMAHNISLTEDPGWQFLDPSKHQEELAAFSKLFPSRSYRINETVFVRSGEKTPITGVYAPDLENACPQFLGTHCKCAPLASVCIGTEDLVDPGTGEKYDRQNIYKNVECTWYLVERDEEKPDAGYTPRPQFLKVAAGQSCPQTGFYFSPAVSGSRRRFIKGEEMPSSNSTYGQTIWQWDEVQ